MTGILDNLINMGKKVDTEVKNEEKSTENDTNVTKNEEATEINNDKPTKVDYNFGEEFNNAFKDED